MKVVDTIPELRQWAHDQRTGAIDWPRIASKLLLPTVFVMWLAFLSITSPNFLTPQNLFNVTRQVAVIGILSIGQLLCLITGNIDLSVGTFLGLSGALVAGFSLVFGVPAALAITLLFTLFWGFSNGFLVTRGKGLSVIVTLSTMYIARGLLLIYTDGHPVINFPMPYGFIGSGNLGPIPWSLITFAAVALLVLFVLRFTPMGRHFYATGGNEQAARVCGVNVKTVVIRAYMASALLSFLAGIVLLGRIASAQPTAGMGLELDSIAAVLIGGASVSGGAGGVIATVIGIFLLGFISNGLNLLGVSSFYQFVFKGIIILLAVLIDNLQRRSN